MDTTALKASMIDLVTSWHPIVEAKGITYPLPIDLDSLEIRELRTILTELRDLAFSPT